VPASVQIGQIQLADQMPPAACKKQQRKPVHRTDASGANQTAPARTARARGPGYVRSSTSMVEELVNMIQTQRAYEINNKAVRRPTKCWPACRDCKAGAINLRFIGAALAATGLMHGGCARMPREAAGAATHEC
jgi:hypothetical protein